MATIEDMFRKTMADNGYKMIERKDSSIVRIIAFKQKHYTIELLKFKGVAEKAPEYAIKGSIGTDVNGVFYFRINPPLINLEKRYNDMLEAMKPFMEEVVERKELQLTF